MPDINTPILNTPDAIMKQLATNIDVYTEKTKYLSDPIQYVTDHFGIPWSKQKEIIEAVFFSDKKIVLVRSCNDVGKTWVLAAIHWAWLDLYRPNARIVTSATNYGAVKTMQWTAIREHYIKVRDRFDKAPINLTDFTPYPDQFPKYLSVGISPKIEGSQSDPNAKAIAFQGHHSAHTLFIVDEAMSTPPAVMGAIEGSLLDKGAKALVVFNPTANVGTVVDLEKYDKRVKLITISTDDLFNSPEYKEDPEHYIELADPQAVQDLIDTYGEESAIVYARVKGEYPKQDENAAINYHDVIRCKDRVGDEKYDQPEKIYKIVYSWDVAGQGADTNILGRLESSEIRETIRKDDDTETVRIQPITKYNELKQWNAKHNESLKIVYHIIADDIEAWKKKVKEADGELEMPLFYLVNDAVGEGSHVQSIFEEWFEDDLNCVAFKGGGKAEMIVEREQVDLLNKNAEAWYRTKLLVEESVPEWGLLILNIDTQCVAELTSRKCEWKAKLGEPMVWFIEPKKEYKLRAGGKSPDKADALIMGVWCLLSESGVLIFNI